MDSGEVVTYDGKTYQLAGTEIISGNNIYSGSSSTDLVGLSSPIVYQQISRIEFALSELQFSDSVSKIRIGTDDNYNSSTYKADVTKSSDDGYTLTLNDNTDSLIVDVNSETKINDEIFSPTNAAQLIVYNTSTRAYNGDFKVTNGKNLSAKKIISESTTGEGESQTTAYTYSETTISTSGEISVRACW